jgi:hypothetical protein
MSQGVSNTALLDLTKTTLENLPNMEFEVCFKHQEYNVVNQWFQSEKVQEESGTSIKRNIVFDTTGNARHVRLYQKTAIGVADTQVQISAPWVQCQSHYSIERREILRNRKPAAFINLLKSRRIDATVDLANMLEDSAWLAPLNSSDDLNPYGLPYWLNHCNTGVTTGGFVGQTILWRDGSTTANTTIGGLDASSSSYARWRNYADVYSSIDGTFVKRMRKAFHASQFKSPMIAKDLTDGPAGRFKIYMGLDELVEYEDLATKQNDNNGADLDKFHGVTTFKRVPILYAPPLDDTTVNPYNAIYAVNHAKFFPIVLSGDWMREDEPVIDAEQHNVITQFIDCSYQYFCTNRRLAGFVMHNPF